MRTAFIVATRLGLALAASGVFPGSLHAQTRSATAERDRFWFSGGVGYGRTGKVSQSPFNTGVAVGLAVTYQPGVWLVSARTSTVWNFFEGELVDDVALLVGVGTRARGGHLSLAVGPALTGGNLGAFRASSRAFEAQLGLAAHLQFMAAPLAEVGIGLSAFGNLNRHQSFGGVLFSLALGRLR